MKKIIKVPVLLWVHRIISKDFETNPIQCGMNNIEGRQLLSLLYSSGKYRNKDTIVLDVEVKKTLLSHKEQILKNLDSNEAFLDYAKIKMQTFTAALIPSVGKQEALRIFFRTYQITETELSFDTAYRSLSKKANRQSVSQKAMPKSLTCVVRYSKNEAIINMLLSNTKKTQIAKELNCSRQNVYERINFLKKSGFFYP